jgi:hypothetical protein
MEVVHTSIYNGLELDPEGRKERPWFGSDELGRRWRLTLTTHEKMQCQLGHQTNVTTLARTPQVAMVAN